MNLDDLKSAWKQRNNELGKDRFDALAADVVARTSSMEAKLLRRDLFETGAAIIVLIASVLFLWLVPCPIILMKIGLVILMLSAIEVIVVLFWTRWRDDRPNHDAPLLEFCTAEVARLDRQIQLLRSITWWYSGPLLLGPCLIIFGALTFVALPSLVFYGFLAAFFACFLAAAFILYRMNSDAAETRLVPLRDELAELVRSFEDGVSENDSESGDPDRRSATDRPSYS